jgi:hypothetical protein
LRILRCYLKHYSKWKHYDLSIDKQRELILNCEVLDCDEEYVDEVIPYDGKISTSGGIQRNIFIDRNDWFKKKRNSNINLKVKLYWYVDIDGREKLNQLANDIDVNETFYSADFTADYSIYEVQPDALIKEDTESAVFYQTIFEVLRNKVSLREIARSVSSDEISIAHAAIGNLKGNAGI